MSARLGEPGVGRPGLGMPRSGTQRLRVVREHPRDPARLRAGAIQPPHGLPGPLPPGETMLWQGSPSWRGVARRVLHVRTLLFYFAALALVALVRAVVLDTASMWFSLAALMLLGTVALALLSAFAVLVARTSVYTLTGQRVVLRIGVALGISINLPFRSIESADLRLYPDGTGDIALLLEGQSRLGITTLWPHVRPWRTRRVQPMLRAVPDAARVARLLADALATSAQPEVVALLAAAE
ncbi:MAG: photosynthetic complex putative assembly protein PuhB [Janthinobacterium lividum]